MGTMSFLLPNDISADAAQELERACVVGGPDSMPWPTEVQIEPGRILLHRGVEESGAMVAPWAVNGFGRLMSGSGTLIERSSPYHFEIELARGKVNQVRSQSAEWQMQGMYVAPALKQQITDASRAFGRAVVEADENSAGPKASDALLAGYRSAEEMVLAYVEQMFQARHQRQQQLDCTLACRVAPTTDIQELHADLLLRSCNGMCVPFVWKDIEPTEGDYRWEMYDALISWAEDQALYLSAGPLVDFAPFQLPTWLLSGKRDLASLSALMCDYVEEAIRRYRGRIRTWQLTCASNFTNSLALGEDELLWLTVRLAEAARQVDPNLALVVGVSQPWGEYMTFEDRTHSPFIFADTLVRSGINLAALELEIVMGVAPRGSYCRDLLEMSRLLDLYALLGTPLHVTLGYPSSDAIDDNADPDLKVGAGHWREGFSTEIQAEWANYFGALILCKPVVRSIIWSHLTDAAPHQFPNCGLFDSSNQPKPVAQSLHRLRELHLR